MISNDLDLNMRDNRNLTNKLYKLCFKWPVLTQLRDFYKNRNAVKTIYGKVLNKFSSVMFKTCEWEHLNKDEYTELIDKIFNHAYTYRSIDYEKNISISSRHDIVVSWLSRCIDEAIEECVIKIPTEQLMPDDPVDTVRRYLELKLFGEWKNVELNGKPSLYYINEVGDYYDAKLDMMVKKSYTRSYTIKALGNSACREIHKPHRDVARYFIPNNDPEHKTEVNHINGVKTCNAVFNLEWCDQKLNSEHAVRNGLLITRNGENNPASKYTNEQIKQVCQLLQDHTNYTYEKIAEITGIHRGMIGSICRGEARADISKNYDFSSRVIPNKYSEQQIHHVCQLLQDRPDLTFEEVSRLTGVMQDTVGLVYRREQWTAISSKYRFPIRDNIQKGKNKWNNKYSEEQIHHACKLLRDEPRTSTNIIFHKTGVDVKTIWAIYNGDSWKHISKDYMPFPKRDARAKGENNGSAKYSETKIREVCQLLQDRPDLMFREIADIARVPVFLPGMIYRRETWNSVSKDYIFPERKIVRKSKK